jgi:hypothetical protein
VSEAKEAISPNHCFLDFWKGSKELSSLKVKGAVLFLRKLTLACEEGNGIWQLTN